MTHQDVDGPRAPSSHQAILDALGRFSQGDRSARVSMEGISDASLRSIAHAINTALEAGATSQGVLSAKQMVDLSHDLRSPLNSLLLLARMLAESGEDELTSTQRRAAQMILDAGEEILSHVDSLRALAGPKSS